MLFLKARWNRAALLLQHSAIWIRHPIPVRSFPLQDEPDVLRSPPVKTARKDKPSEAFPCPPPEAHRGIPVSPYCPQDSVSPPCRWKACIPRSSGAVPAQCGQDTPTRGAPRTVPCPQRRKSPSSVAGRPFSPAEAQHGPHLRCRRSAPPCSESQDVPGCPNEALPAGNPVRTRSPPKLRQVRRGVFPLR